MSVPVCPRDGGLGSLDCVDIIKPPRQQRHEKINHQGPGAIQDYLSVSIKCSQRTTNHEFYFFNG